MSSSWFQFQFVQDLTAVNAYVVGYDVYMLKKKKCCSYNPPDAIAC